MSFFTYIKQKYSTDTCLLLKQYSRNMKKLGKLSERLKYLLTCRKKGLTPKHLTNTTKITKQLFTSTRISKELHKIEIKFQRKLLNLEIKDTNYNIHYIKEIINESKLNIAQSIGTDEYNEFMKRQNSNYYETKTENKRIHLNKIESLKKDKFKEHNLKFNPEWFVNQTSISVPDESKWLLSLGPKFALPIDSNNFSTIDLIADLEQWVQTLTDDREKDVIRTKIANRILTHKRTMKNDDREKYILDIYDETRRLLRRYKNEIVLTKSDKGNKTVLLYKSDYNEGMKKLLEDRNTYKNIKVDPTLKLQRANNTIIAELYKKEYINTYEKFKMTTNAATAPRLYGLPKIHKQGTPLRPISSSIGVPCYELSKHIGNILKSIVLEKYNIKNSLELKEQLDTIKLDQNEILISLDVVSLFTNIPIHLAIRNIMTKWDILQYNTKIPKKQFLKILQFCLNDNNYFMYGEKLYHQTYGMPMGNPLSPTVADIILDNLLEECIEELRDKNVEIKLIKKYVDDLFAIIKRKDEEIIMKTFNSYHNKLRFTLERENQCAIPYLDMIIIRDQEKIKTNWYMKPIASGRLINFYSTQPMKQKTNTATNLIEKALKLSSPEFKDDNLTKIKQILTNNNFPNKIISSLINRVYNKTPPRDNKIENPSGNPKYYSLPFIPRLTENNKIRNIINEDVIIAHRSNKTIGNLFTQTKTKIESRERSDVVYQITCDGNDNDVCGKVYIGTTKRHLGVRIDEHKADIKRKKQSTALAQHCIDNDHKPNFDRVKILDNEKRENKRYTLESLRIQQQSKSAINTKEDKDNCSASYTIAIF